MTKSEKDVLLYFLRAGFSTRQLDKLILELNPKITKGFSSWEILKKYKLRKEDKHKLFIYGVNQAKNIILKINTIDKVGAIDILIKANRPSNIEKYFDAHILAKSEKSLEKILSGETRNIIRDFFLPQKRIIGECQYKNCNTKNLDTCHFKKSRPEIFRKSASKYKKDLNGLFLFDLHKIFEDFLDSHKEKRSVCFLCRYHHNKLANAEKSSKTDFKRYTKDIEWVFEKIDR